MIGRGDGHEITYITAFLVNQLTDFADTLERNIDDHQNFATRDLVCIAL